MAYVRRATWLVTVLVLMSVSKSMHAQQAGQLQPTATAAAGASFRSAIYESQNLGPARAASHIAAAIAADPQFGLARIYQTVLMPGLTAQQRESQIRQHLAGMGGANPAEILMGVYWRESAAGRAAGAVPILKAVAEMVPGDAEVGYIFNGTERAGKTSAEQVAILRSFLARFPGHAAAHNQMAYTLWAWATTMERWRPHSSMRGMRPSIRTRMIRTRTSCCSSTAAGRPFRTCSVRSSWTRLSQGHIPSSVRST